MLSRGGLRNWKREPASACAAAFVASSPRKAAERRPSAAILRTRVMMRMGEMWPYLDRGVDHPNRLTPWPLTVAGSTRGRFQAILDSKFMSESKLEDLQAALAKINLRDERSLAEDLQHVRAKAPEGQA